MMQENYNSEDYIDDIGGYHSPGNCYNPLGYFCGDCTKISCSNCKFKDYTQEQNLEKEGTLSNDNSHV